MCFIKHTRYACGHISPLHRPGYQRPNPPPPTNTPGDPGHLIRQSNPLTEWPTHPDTTIEGCQDAGRRGVRCTDLLEDMKTMELDSDKLCEDCKKAGQGGDTKKREEIGEGSGAKETGEVKDTKQEATGDQ